MLFAVRWGSRGPSSSIIIMFALHLNQSQRQTDHRSEAGCSGDAGPCGPLLPSAATGVVLPTWTTFVLQEVRLFTETVPDKAFSVERLEV